MRSRTTLCLFGAALLLRGISKSQDKQVCQGECRFLAILQREKDLLCKSQNFQISYADFAKQPLL